MSDLDIISEHVDALIRHAEREGYKDGYEDGYKRGYRDRPQEQTFDPRREVDE